MKLLLDQDEEKLDIYANNGKKAKYMVRFSFSPDMGIRQARDLVETFVREKDTEYH